VSHRGAGSLYSGTYALVEEDQMREWLCCIYRCHRDMTLLGSPSQTRKTCRKLELELSLMLWRAFCGDVLVLMR
jgi:hypothetical protein